MKTRYIILFLIINSNIQNIFANSYPSLDSTKLYAQAFLDNKVYPTDDLYTFYCLDKLSSEKSKERNYYFEVLKVIMVKADGALSEVVGSYILKYLRLYTDEAITKYFKLDNQLKKYFVNHISYEIYFDDNANNSKDFIDLYFNKLTAKSNIRHLDKFNLFKQELYLSFQGM